MNQLNKKVAIVLAGDEKLDFAIANVIIGLKRYSESLIDRVFVYTDMPQEKRDKISLVWRDKITFVSFSYEDCVRDFIEANDGQMESLPIRENERYTHHIYAKFYCFDILRDYDYVIWLDSDVLVQNSIEEILAVETDFKWCNGSYKANVELYLKYYDNIKGKEHRIVKPNGGMLSLSKNILNKISIPLRIECYKILKKYFAISLDVAGSDEAPFGILAFQFNLIFIRVQGANIAPNALICDKNTLIVHSAINSKFWSSPFSSLLFGEWYVNHKEWEKIIGRKVTLNFRESNLPIKNEGNAYNLLVALHCFQPLCTKIVKYISESFMYMIPPFGDFFEIRSVSLQNYFYRFKIKNAHSELNVVCELQLVYAHKEELESEKILCIFQEIAKAVNANIVRNIAQENRELLCVKNVNLKNIEECIQEFLFLKAVSFAPIYQYLLKENEKSSGYETFFTAASRIQSHLAYKLGQILIKDSKSLIGVSKLPLEILLIILKHRREQRQYKAKIANNPNLKLPPLESYLDYKESLKIKNYFSYQLGEAFLVSFSAKGGGRNSHLYTQSA